MESKKRSALILKLSRENLEVHNIDEPLWVIQNSVIAPVEDLHENNHPVLEPCDFLELDGTSVQTTVITPREEFNQNMPETPVCNPFNCDDISIQNTSVTLNAEAINRKNFFNLQK